MVRKNKALVKRLEEEGLLTEFGKIKIEEAKNNGQWNNVNKLNEIMDEQINEVSKLLRANKQAYENFQAMSPSVKKTYTRAYFDAKTENGRIKRLDWMTDRLEKI
ncbi:YdeI family protein [Enterococcus termitis]